VSYLLGKGGKEERRKRRKRKHYALAHPAKQFVLKTQGAGKEERTAVDYAYLFLPRGKAKNYFKSYVSSPIGREGGGESTEPN